MSNKSPLALLFLFITFGSLAKDISHLKVLSYHRGGFNSHNAFADTAETPDEHIREKQTKATRQVA
ncbi:hypothetical protein [Martelella alba]|uniref:Uncharacterized protein n=1 Tax=Martelella alba TaxID=2590451 RepID=A0ABY2SIK1_9HYPH|nr:hypothetical protein [Martelella alba]TKI05043.1 hypothetical protein FCN80_16070 [Martelella alba]